MCSHDLTVNDMIPWTHTKENSTYMILVASLFSANLWNRCPPRLWIQLIIVISVMKTSNCWGSSCWQYYSYQDWVIIYHWLLRWANNWRLILHPPQKTEMKDHSLNIGVICGQHINFVVVSSLHWQLIPGTIVTL